MWKNFCRWLLYSRLGWRKEITVSHPDKFILCLAPHTSNWDFVLGRLYAGAEGLSCNFLMKKEWFVWPLSILFRRWGGIPVWRNKHTSMTDNLAQEAEKSKTFRLCVTPEGTRSRNPDWKRGSILSPSKRGSLSYSMALIMKSVSSNAPKRLFPTGIMSSKSKKSNDTIRTSMGRSLRISR